MNYQDLRNELATLADEGYAEFSKRGTPTEYPILGVRVPHLREIAKRISQKPQNTKAFLKIAPVSLEELLIKAIVIAKLPYNEFKQELPTLLKQIDNWAACDTLVSSAKTIKKNREDFLEVLDRQYLQGSEFETRFALVVLKAYYLDADYLPVVLDRAAAVKGREEYYIKMALAWLLAEAFIKFPDETASFLLSAGLPEWTLKKTIAKICDSYRVDEDAKEVLKSQSVGLQKKVSQYLKSRLF